MGDGPSVRRSARWWTVRLAGILGPAGFTSAWVSSQRRQTGYDTRVEQISGLAAPDAHDPWVMTSGFLSLGAGSLLFASAAEQALGGKDSAGFTPYLLRVAGTAAIVAGLMRRDQMLIDRDPSHIQSGMNDIHDATSGVGYMCLVVAPAILARRMRHDPELRDLVLPAVATTGVTAACVSVLASGRGVRWHGVVQRVGVTVPLAFLVRVALRLIRSGR